MHSYKKMIGKKGFTIIELIIVIAIMVILASISIPVYTNVLNKAKYTADQDSVAILNSLTSAYASMKEIEVADVFSGIESDEAKIALLVSESFLAETVTPAQEDAQFVWNWGTNMWEVSGGAELDEGAGSLAEGSTYPEWVSGTKYGKTIYVTYEGKTYYSHKSTNKEPGSHKDWQEISDFWVKLNTYKKGDTIIYDGKTYVALKDSDNKKPQKDSKYWAVAE